MITLVSLHGFLGLSDDWNFLKCRFPQYDILAPNLFERNVFCPGEGLIAAGNRVNQLGASLKSPKILIGYSLGARIALHAMPGVWTGAVLISPHPGLATTEERLCRMQSDQAWAEKFLRDPWEDLISEWNLQKVFTRPSLPKAESDFSREVLSRALTGWSLGQQENYLPRIETWKLPLLWVTGEEDIKFTTIAKNVKLSHPRSRHVVIPEASHRVPWENEPEFSKELKLFINSIK